MLSLTGDRNLTLDTMRDVNDEFVGFDVNINDYSSLHRWYMVIAYILRFKHNLLACIRNFSKLLSDISLIEYRNAERTTIKYEQF